MPVQHASHVCIKMSGPIRSLCVWHNMLFIPYPPTRLAMASRVLQLMRQRLPVQPHQARYTKDSHISAKPASWNQTCRVAALTVCVNACEVLHPGTALARSTASDLYMATREALA